MRDHAIARCVARHNTVRAELAEWRHVDAVGSSFSNLEDGSSDGSQLLGRGRFLSAEDRSALRVDIAIVQYVRDFAPAGWPQGLVSEPTVLLYTYAQLEGHELLHSTRYTRACCRVSYNALCSFYEHAEGGY